MDGTKDIVDQFIEIARATVCQFPFGQRPDALIGIELRCISGKIFDAQAPMFVENPFDWRSFVGRGVIEQNDDWASEAAQQLTQEHTHLVLSYVVIEEQIVEPQTMPPGAYRNS